MLDLVFRLQQDPSLESGSIDEKNERADRYQRYLIRKQRTLLHWYVMRLNPEMKDEQGHMMRSIHR